MMVAKDRQMSEDEQYKKTSQTAKESVCQLASG